MQTQVGEDLLDHRLFQDRGDDLQFTAAVRAVLQVEVEHPLEQPSPDTNSPVDCLCLARGRASGPARPARPSPDTNSPVEDINTVVLVMFWATAG